MVVGSKANLIQSFGHAPVLFPQQAFVRRHSCAFLRERMRGVFVFFVSMCADLPASPGVLACVCRHVCKATNTTHECKHTHTHTRSHQADTCRHGNAHRCQQKRLQGEHCLPLVQQGAIYLNVATKGSYLHETRAVSGKWGSH